MRKSNIITLIMFINGFTQLLAQSEFIHIDQFGYLPEMNKVAVISNPQLGFNASLSYSPGSVLEVRRYADHQVVFSSAPVQWNGGLTHNQSGDAGWWFDFSTLQAHGEYYIHDPSTMESTEPFTIHLNVYQELMAAATKMFYYNRCNADKPAEFAGQNWTDGMNFSHPLQDSQCRFVYDPNNVSLEKDLSGGWFDAGDYNKYVTFAESAVHDLLSAYEENPDAFSDHTGIPESGNGVPDIIDELKWELDWLMKMNNPDGTTHIKMGSIDYSHNSAAPPSVNTDQRYYGPVCSAASLVISGIFAHAAIVFSDFPQYAAYSQSLLLRSQSAWSVGLTSINNGSLDLDCDDGTILSGDADRTENEQKESAITAAAYLFMHTSDSSYEAYISTHLTDIEAFTTAYWTPYKLTVETALLSYANHPQSDTQNAQDIINSLSTSISNNWSDFHGFNDLDLYRSFMPDWAYHWGSNLPKAGFGTLNQLSHHYAIPGSNDSHAQKSEEQVHYFHGVNPLGLVQLSNMQQFGAEHSVNEVYHTWFNDGTDWDNVQTSLYGPAPGFLTGGANAQYSNSNISPPFGQPAQKSYLEFNSGFPENSWEITEPGIYYQAAYIRLLANYVKHSCPEDINGDGAVDIDDFLLFNSAISQPCFACPEDIDEDGTVGVDDFLLLNSAYGSTCN